MQQSKIKINNKYIYHSVNLSLQFLRHIYHQHWEHAYKS